MKILTSICLIAATLTITHASAADCDSVYRGSVRDITKNSDHKFEKSYYFNLYCEKTGETKEIMTSASAAFPIKGIPIDVSGDGNFSQEELKEFCKIGQEQNYYESEANTFESSVVVGALKSYNECVALREKDIIISHTTNHPKGVTIDVQLRNPDLSLIVHGISGVGDGVECISTGLSSGFFSWADSVVVDEKKDYEVKNREFSVICNRTAEKTGDVEYYPPRLLTLSTSAGSYPVTLIEDKLHGYHLASEAKKSYHALLSERNELIKQRDTEAANADYRARKLSGLELRIVYQGDNHMPNDAKFTCPSLGGPTLNNTHYQQACSPGKKMISVRRTQSTSGGHCGHTSYAVLCSIP